MPFRESGRKVTVSNNGGHQPRWSRDGKELFYVQGETLMAVSVSTDGEFSAGSPEPLFNHPGLRRALGQPRYDVSLDGRRFILPEPVGFEEGKTIPSTIHVVQNWYEEFRDREQE